MLWNGEGVGAGTLVATPDGPVPAERLQRGGKVLGGSGRTLTLTELRHVTLSAVAFRRLGLAPPVQIAPGALGFGMPAATLLLGPAQRIRLAGGWIAADLLVDGLDVRRRDGDARMVLLALADDAPLMAAGVMLAPASASAARPLPMERGPATAALLRQAGAARMPAGALAGHVDHADRTGVTGWALDTAVPDRVVALEVVVAGAVVAQVLADQPRPDLARNTRAGLARHGFTWAFSHPLPAGRSWLIDVRRAGGGAALPGTPLLLDAAAAAPERFDIALAGLADGPCEVQFLAQLIENATRSRRR